MRKSATSYKCVGAIFLVSSAAVSYAATPEPALEEVIVTAQKRAQNIQDVPASVTALSEEYMETRGLDELRDYSRFVPGFIYGTTAGGGERSGPDITIRGVSNTRLGGFDTSIATATTGYLFGEFPMFSMDARIADIERIEVLKGPQGTLYGAGAMGGILKVVPNKPRADQLTGSVSVDTSMTTDGGSNLGWNGHLNVPIRQDVLAARIVGYHYKDSGFIDARIPRGTPGELRGRNGLITSFNSNDVAVFPVGGAEARTIEDIDSETVAGARLSLRYTPNDRFDATVTALVQTTDLESFHNFEPVLTSEQNKRVTEIYLLQPEKTENYVTSLEASYDFGPVTLTSISGWLNRTLKQSADLTTTVYGIFGGNGTVRVPSAVPTSFNADIEVYSEELRFQGVLENLGSILSSIDWTIGYFYQYEDRRLFNDVFPGPDWNANAVAPVRPIPSPSGYLYSATYYQNYTNSALFADLTVNVTPRLALSAGARRADQDLESLREDFGGLSGAATLPTFTSQAVEVSEAATTARGAISFKLTNNQLYYASASEGFRIGGGNPGAVLAPSPACQAALATLGASNGTYESDSIWNYEVGAKTTWNDGRIITNVSVYRIDWTDLQSTVFLGVFNPGCTSTITSNAGEARIEGVELDAQARVTDSFQLALAASFANAEVTDPESSALARKGDPLKNIPDYSVSVGAQYEFPMMLNMNGYIRGDYSAIGERSVSPVAAGQLPGFTLPSYELLNLRFGASHENWDFAVYLDNVFDKAALLDVLRRPGGPGVFPATGPAPGVPAGTQLYISTNQPRTIGLTVKRSF